MRGDTNQDAQAGRFELEVRPHYLWKRNRVRWPILAFIAAVLFFEGGSEDEFSAQVSVRGLLITDPSLSGGLLQRGRVTCFVEWQDIERVDVISDGDTDTPFLRVLRVGETPLDLADGHLVGGTAAERARDAGRKALMLTSLLESTRAS